MPRQQKTESKTRAGDSAFAPPYPPSWFDRFTAWVHLLPGAVRDLVAAILLPVTVWAIQLLLGRLLGA